jgi:predicted phage terminase large subunit-like protein
MSGILSRDQALATALRKAGEWQFADSKETCEDSLFDFVKTAWPYIDSSEFKTCWAIEAFCEHLEAVTYGFIPRLLANYPPRSAKTTIASICWPAWTWIQQEKTFLSGPQVRFLCGSYSASLALMNSNKERRLILSPWYQANWGDMFLLKDDQNTKSMFDTTAGGSRISTSVGGSLLGLGGDVICIDDPHNTETEKLVETDADRKKVASWWQEVHSTRLNDPKQSAIVVVMQRLHSGDLSGVILDSNEDWTHLMIPMEYDERRCSVTVVLPKDMDDPDAEPWHDPRRETADAQGHDGQLMWPERFGRKEVDALKTALGPFMAAGRLQQQPVPKGGGIIQRDWWQLWDMEQAQSYGLEWNEAKGARKEFPEMSLIIASLDTSFKEKEENDFNAMTVWGLWLDRAKNRRAMLMYAWAKRLPLHGEIVSAKAGEAKINFQDRQKAKWGLVEWVADTCKRYGVQRLLIEDKARGGDVANELKRLYARDNWGVELLLPERDKVSRAHTTVPLFADGCIWAPSTTWSEPCLVECELFPKGPHDDYVDTVTQFINWARVQELLVRGDEASAALADEMKYLPKQQSVADSYGV